MKLKYVILSFIMILGFASSPVITARAKTHHYTTTPTSLRGTWYNYQSYKLNSKVHHKWNKMTIKKHSFQYNKDINLSGKKKFKEMSGYQLGVGKGHKKTIFSGYWMIGKNYTDQTFVLKKVRHKDHTALKELISDGLVRYTQYWYHSKIK